MALTNIVQQIGSDGFSGILSGVNQITGSAGSIIKKVKSLVTDEKSVAAIRDINTNGFLAQNSMFAPEFFARMFDEPTYISFRIEFMFDDPSSEKPFSTDPELISRNTIYNNQGVLNSAFTSVFYNDMYDNMPEPFLEGWRIRNGEDGSIGMTFSTEHYLDYNLGDHARAALLSQFKLALRDIQDNFPYYFTSISGLDTLTNIDPEGGIRVKEGLIELECMEGLDMKITQLIQMYRKIVWDDVYQRWILPDMMRYFGMRIYVSEIRVFQDVKRESASTGESYDFNASDIRNMTYKGQYDNKSLLDKGLGILGKATAVSNAFLGTKSIITKALNYTSGTVNTVLGAYNSIAGALNDIQYCNNAINEVMPTLCFECHMCEFDISDTMSYMSSLSSNTHDTNALAPKIKIKVGQVKEKQAYTLNRFLKKGATGYKKISEASDVPKASFEKTGAFRDAKEETIGYFADFISDDIFNKTYKDSKIDKRVKEGYIENVKNEMMRGEANTLGVKRLPKTMIDEHDKMSYTPGRQSQSAAKAGLFATIMNEAVAIGTSSGIGSNIVGTQSKATDPDTQNIHSMEAIGIAMNAAVERIYGGPEMTSMAVQGVSDQQRASIANKLFSDYIDSLDRSTDPNSNLGRFIRNYRMFESRENNR